MDLSSQLEDLVCWIGVISGLASLPSPGQRDQLHRAVFGPRDLSSQLDDSACQIGVTSGPACVPSSGQRDKLHRAVFSPRDLSSQLEDLFCWVWVVIRPARHPHFRSTRLSASSSISSESTRPAALCSYYLQVVKTSSLRQ